MLNELIQKYHIQTVKFTQPYPSRLIGRLGDSGAFLAYKDDRSNVLKDRQGKFFGKGKPEEVYSKMK